MSWACISIRPSGRSCCVLIGEESDPDFGSHRADLAELPGLPERATHDDKRSGTSSLYAALDLTTGKVIESLHARHRAIEFKKLLQDHRSGSPGRPGRPRGARQRLDAQDAGGQTLAAGAPEVRGAHFTPTSSSWLNLVERWFGELTTKKLRRGTHRSVRELNTDIRTWIETWNNDPRPYVWTKTADQILVLHPN